MGTVAKKIMMGSGAVALPSDDQFNRTSFLSHFDGTNNGVNSQFTDGSASNHTITANGNVTQGSFGPFARPDGEWGVSFDGDDYLTVAETGADEFTFGTGDFTIEGWINNQAVDASQSRTIISTAQGNDFQGIWFGINGGKYYYIYNNSGAWSVIVDAGTPVANAWTHFALVRNGTSNVVYINGSSIGSTTETARDLTNTNNLLAIGGRATSSQYTISTMSNVRVVKGTAVYTGNFTPATSKLTAITNTKLLTCQSNRFVDNSASPLTITPAGNPSVTAFGPFLTSAGYSAGTNGASAYLASGDSDYLQMPAQTIPTGSFTLEGWYYLAGSGSVTGQTVISQGSSGNSRRTFFGIEGSEFTFQMGNTVERGPTIFRNSWNHFACVYNSSYPFIQGWHNGVSTGATGQSNGDAENVAMQIGTLGSNWASGYGLTGYVSDIRVSSGIKYTANNITVPTSPLAVQDSNTKLLLNMADGQAIDSAAQNNLTLDDNTKISNGQAKFGTTSLLFDGTNDYAKTIFKTSFGAGNFTIEYFFRVSSVSTNQNLFQFGDAFLPDDDGGPGLGIRTSRWRLYTGANTATHHGSAGPSNDTWYHIAVVRNGTTTKLYVDGVETISVSDSYDYSPRKYLLLGGGFDGSYDMNGYMDEFRVSYFARYTSNNFTVPSEPFPDKGQ